MIAVRIILCSLLLGLHYLVIHWYPETKFLRILKVIIYFVGLIVLGIAMRRFGK
jgi:hypothetical protein